MRQIILAAVLALAVAALAELWPLAPVYADGSDPMPLCRPTPSKPCPKPPGHKEMHHEQ